MTEMGIASIVAMLGWLVLVIAGYRSYQLGASKTIQLILIWSAIFVTVGLLFSVMV